MCSYIWGTKDKNTFDVEEMKRDINKQKVQLEALTEKVAGISLLCYAKTHPGRKPSDAIQFSRSTFSLKSQHKLDPSSVVS